MRVILLTIGAVPGSAHRFPGREADAPDLASFKTSVGRLPTTAWVVRSPAPAAAACAEAAGLLATHIDPALRDRDPGAWAGQPIEAVAAANPELFARWLDNPDAAPPGGESAAALMARAAQWLTELDPSDGTAIAVTHPTVVRGCLAAVLGDPAAWFTFDIAHATRTVLTRHTARWRIRGVNLGL